MYPSPRRRWPLWLRVLRDLAVLLVIALGLVYLLQNKLIFHPDRVMQSPEHWGLSGVEQVDFAAADGTRLHNWFAPPAPGRATLLFFQGNAGNLSHRARRMWEAQSAGFGMLLLGYRGYGQSEGSPDEPGLYQDSRAALAWLRARREVDPGKLVFFGESLGCAVALELAAQEPPAALVLEAPFASMREEAAVAFPWLPTALLLRSRFDNLQMGPRVRCPALVAHGNRDAVVPIAQGKKVFAALAGAKRFVELACGHNDIPDVGGNPYRKTVREFIEQATAGGPPVGAP